MTRGEAVDPPIFLKDSALPVIAEAEIKKPFNVVIYIFSEPIIKLLIFVFFFFLFNIFNIF